MSEVDLAFHFSKARSWAHPCAGCGAMVSEGESEIEVEKEFPEDLGGLVFRRVWHQPLPQPVFRSGRRSLAEIGTLNYTDNEWESRHEHIGE